MAQGRANSKEWEDQLEEAITGIKNADDDFFRPVHRRLAVIEPDSEMATAMLYGRKKLAAVFRALRAVNKELLK